MTVGDDGIAVADRGPGIPDGELALVFDRFHRSDEARVVARVGLGLSIVRDVAAVTAEKCSPAIAPAAAPWSASRSGG